MSVWTTRAATVEDAVYVYDHIWERGAKELSGYGITREKWIAQWAYMTVIPNCTQAFLHDGKIIAVLGVDKIEGIAKTWFQATADFDRFGRGLTRQMRKVIDGMARKAGLKKAVLTSLCVSSDAPRWYEFLGLAEDRNFLGAIFSGRIERAFVKEWK